MAEFTDYMQRFIRPVQPWAEMNMDMMVKHLPELSPRFLENFRVTTDFSVDSSFLAPQQPEFPATYSHNSFSSTSHPDILSTAVPAVPSVNLDQNIFHENKKRKPIEQSTSGSNNISPATSTISAKKMNNLGRCKKGKNKEKRVEESAEEVIHVRAKRGQATDSHSIAERVRREKINKKLRCLQDLVPGCHKSMGMAVMLEEIINYVHSLQNQVEFLSMELAAASGSHGLNNVTESSMKPQGTFSPEAQEMQKGLKERYGEITCFYSTNWSI